MLDTFRQWDFGFVLVLGNLRCNEWWFGEGAGDVAAVRAEVKDSWELPVDVKKTVDEPLSNLILQIVRFAAVFGIRGRSFSLEVFDVVVEDLERGSAGRLDGVGAAKDRTPSKS
jgi:hypothetical protein